MLSAVHPRVAGASNSCSHPHPIQDKLLPLHIACKSGASEAVVAELASAYGQALADFPPVRALWFTWRGCGTLSHRVSCVACYRQPELKLPLHYACAHEPPLVAVINVLLDRYPHGVTAEDRSERVPIEIAARNRHVTPKVLRLLCQVDPQWLFKTNVCTAAPCAWALVLGSLLTPVAWLQQTDDPSAARILVDSGNRDLIEFVRETQVGTPSSHCGTACVCACCACVRDHVRSSAHSGVRRGAQQRVPQDMWIPIPEARSSAHPLDNVQNPLSEQSFIAGACFGPSVRPPRC